MPRILIVEDSEIDRILVRSVLENQGGIDAGDLDIVQDAEAALASIAANAPDVVVTDLVMPGMDGLELLQHVKNTHALIPVIVMTSRGSEETAVAALRLGAASYVPKHHLAELLVETIDRVLAAAARRRGRTRLMEVMIETHASFVLDNDRELFRPLLNYLQDTMSEFALFDENETMRVCVAIEEALNNAAEHGNLELDSALRERDFCQYVETMRQRCHEPGYRERRVHFEAHFTPAESVFDIRDEGSGFDRAVLPDPRDKERLTAASGRGLTLMHAFMDDVQFNEAGNRVRMVKRRGPAVS
ncbi:MAG TPA: response regulator [Planctomycetota bacterium]|nr:response regulator [Planctomycetota bacterium]